MEVILIFKFFNCDVDVVKMLPRKVGVGTCIWF